MLFHAINFPCRAYGRVNGGSSLKRAFVVEWRGFYRYGGGRRGFVFQRRLAGKRANTAVRLCRCL